MRQKLIAGFLTFVGVLGLTICTYAAPINFTDGIFNDTDWSSSIIFENGTQSASFTAYQVTAGGNPGEYRALNQHYGGNGNIITSHLFNGATYIPMNQGAVASLNFSFDTILFNGGNSNGVAYGGLIFQNNSYYRAGYELVSSNNLNQWENHNLNLLASDFVLVSGTGPAIPDFSPTGSTIQFGYVGLNGTAGVPTSAVSHKFCPLFWQFDFGDCRCSHATSGNGSVRLTTVSIKRS